MLLRISQSRLCLSQEKRRTRLKFFNCSGWSGIDHYEKRLLYELNIINARRQIRIELCVERFLVTCVYQWQFCLFLTSIVNKLSDIHDNLTVIVNTHHKVIYIFRQKKETSKQY